MICQDLIPSREICNFDDAVDYALEKFAGEVFVVSVDDSDPPILELLYQLHEVSFIPELS